MGVSITVFAACCFLLLLLLLDSLFYFASLALVNSEISRYYHVAGHAQPADSATECACPIRSAQS
jgi:hypothetical protein